MLRPYENPTPNKALLQIATFSDSTHHYFA